MYNVDLPKWHMLFPLENIKTNPYIDTLVFQ